MTDKDAVTLRNLEDAARQLLAAEAERDAMLRMSNLEYDLSAYDNATKRTWDAFELMHATLTPTGQ